MRFKIITSHQDTKLEIEDGDNMIIIKEMKNGNLSIEHKSLNKDIKIKSINSNNFELEFNDKNDR